MRKRQFTALGGWLLLFLLLCAVAVSGMAPQVWGGVVLLLVLPVGTWGMNFLLKEKLEAELKMPSTAEKGKEIQAEVTIQNHARIPAVHLFCTVQAENRLTGENSILELVMSVPAGGSGKSEFTICGTHCGYIHTEISKVTVMDWFGFLPFRIPCKSDGRTSILPNTFSTEVSLQIPYCQQDEEENYAPDRKGNDASEIFQLRDYVPGDPVKQIHWKLSSKLNHILIKEASLPVSRSLLVFWDKNTEEASPDEMDAMAESVSSICQALSQDGVQYTLGWTDGQEICQEEAFTLEELLRLLPQMLKNGQNSVEDGVSLWMDAYGRAEYGKIIYFAKRIPESLEEFSGGEISILLCDGIPADNRWNTMVYHAQTFAEDLQMVVL